MGRKKGGNYTKGLFLTEVDCLGKQGVTASGSEEEKEES